MYIGLVEIPISTDKQASTEKKSGLSMEKDLTVYIERCINK